MNYNQQFVAFIGQLAKASGEFALCESITKGYKLCCEGMEKLDNEYHEQSFLPASPKSADFEKRIDQLVDKLCNNDGFTRNQINNSHLDISNNAVTISLMRNIDPDGSGEYTLQVKGNDPELDKMIRANMFKHVDYIMSYSTETAHGWGNRALANDRRDFLMCLEYAAKVKMPSTIDELRNAINQLSSHGKIPKTLPALRQFALDFIKKRGWGTTSDDLWLPNGLFGYIINQIKMDPLTYTDVHELNLDFFAKLLINGGDHPVYDDLGRFGNGRRLSQREIDRRNEK